MDQLRSLIKADQTRWHALGIVESLGIETACIGAGFIRNLVWDHMHGRQSDCRAFDLDVLWYDADRINPSYDLNLEQQLIELDSSFDWSVKNQARMHTRNGDAPYHSVFDAMRFWPETATAIAAQRTGDVCRLIAPFGMDDLRNMILRPTSSLPHKLRIFEERTIRKDWHSIWPKVQIESTPPD